MTNGLLQHIGNTPLTELPRLSAEYGVGVPVCAKIESFNPGGSVKDRVALAMTDDAERRGLLAPGATIVEPTSGNTGVGLALVAAVKGYRLIVTMPETMSLERRRLLAAFGAEVRLTPAAQGMSGAVTEAERLRAAVPGAVTLRQFDNPANPLCHYLTTGPEIWRDTDGDIAAFVAGAGTGGTITGVGRYLKEQDPSIRIVAMEPASSPLLTRGYAGPHAIQGIGANFVPEALDTSVYDEVVTVTDEDALAAMRELAVKEGLFCGVSSGAAAFAARELAKRPEFQGKNIVCLLPDTGERYLSIM